MKVILVLGLFTSRLQADVAMIRLRRSEVACGRISAVFSRRFMPNTVACWLRAPERLGLEETPDSALVTGPLRADLESAVAGSALSSFLEKAGLDHDVAAAAEQRLEFGNILLGVHAHDEAQASIVSRVFNQSLAEMVAKAGGRADGCAVQASAAFAAA